MDKIEGILVKGRQTMNDNPQPLVGMGATIIMWSDRKPATIIQVSHNGKRIVIQEDISIRLDNNGVSASQEYRYEPDPSGQTHTATLRKDGVYRLASKKTEVHIGVRYRYYDYNF